MPAPQDSRALYPRKQHVPGLYKSRLVSWSALVIVREQATSTATTTIAEQNNVTWHRFCTKQLPMGTHESTIPEDRTRRWTPDKNLPQVAMLVLSRAEANGYRVAYT